MAPSRPALAVVEPYPRKGPPPRKRHYPRKFIVNKINYFNFQQLPLMVRLEHPATGDKHVCQAYPSLCLSHQSFCAWFNPVKSLPEDLDTYRLKEILIPDGSRLFAFSPRQSQISAKGLRFVLPERCEDGNRRRLKRQAVNDVKAALEVGGVGFSGRLLNFNAESFLLRLSAPTPKTRDLLSSGEVATLRLFDGRDTCYTGACRVSPRPVKAAGGGKAAGGDKTAGGEVVLTPLNEAVKCYDPKQYRCQRYQPDLRPDVTLTHPLLKRPLTLKAEDLSGGGFAVHESLPDSLLLPGMRIRDLVLRFQDVDSIRCEVLVIYRKREAAPNGGETRVRCGLVITEISPQDHTRLLAYLTHASNQRTYLCNPVDMDALWHFFFETGFIYPEKYAGFGDRIARIKQTYARLYSTPSNISRHFIYQENGAIRGHVAGIRAYEDSWMIHHLAANTSASPMAGLAVLKQVGHFAMAACNLPTNRMKYILNYHQAEKRFSYRVWEKVARRIDDPQSCYQYGFTYLRIPKTTTSQGLPQTGPYTLHPCRRRDLSLLQEAYQRDKGDLMLAALDLVPERLVANTLTDEYRRMGMRRSRRLFTIKNGSSLEAVCMVIQTDAGLNMSDLLDNIQVLVMPDSEMPAAVLQQLLQALAEPFEQEEVAVMLYPTHYAQDQFLDGHRQYNLWVLNTESSDAYVNYINRITRFV
jgi:hypothetical protein